MAAVNIEIQGISAFECKGNSSALAPRWKKWLQSFQYFLVAKRVVNDAQKKALPLHTAGIEVKELYETLTNPGTDNFEEDTATEYEKTVHTLNAYFLTKLNEPYERHVFRSMTQQDGETQLISSSLDSGNKHRIVISMTPMLTAEIKSSINVDLRF